MTILKFIFSLLGSTKSSKAISTTALALIIGSYFLTTEKVDAKHEIAMKKIRQVEKAAVAMVITQGKILTTLKAINGQITDVKKAVEKTSKRVWQIGVGKKETINN